MFYTQQQYKELGDILEAKREELRDHLLAGDIVYGERENLVYTISLLASNIGRCELLYNVVDGQMPQVEAAYPFNSPLSGSIDVFVSVDDSGTIHVDFDALFAALDVVPLGMTHSEYRASQGTQS